MNLRKKLYLILLITLLASCVFVPHESRDQYRSDGCKVSSKKLVLDIEVIHTGHACRGSSEDLTICLVTYGVIIPVGSFVVSGSVVIVGNILNWIETKGSC